MIFIIFSQISRMDIVKKKKGKKNLVVCIIYKISKKKQKNRQKYESNNKYSFLFRAVYFKTLMVCTWNIKLENTKFLVKKI